MDLDEESLTGVLSLNDPNYDYLGNSLNYFIRSESNDKPDQGYENSVVSAGIGSSFKQFKDLTASIGASLPTTILELLILLHLH